ncbi:MAG TPA: hypothetical protein ENL34_12650 [Chloroflexi bacterium]|nr:hypothetical protein [Chloroflexota bacterium]
MAPVCEEPSFLAALKQWLQDPGRRELDAQAYALLLALVSLGDETDSSTSPEVLAELESLAEQYPELDASVIEEAIRRVVRQPADPELRSRGVS